MPAKAGIQNDGDKPLDPRFREGDEALFDDQAALASLPFSSAKA